eukprot:1853298-Alexandrium_andersonii.AAC.1
MPGAQFATPAVVIGTQLSSEARHAMSGAPAAVIGSAAPGSSASRRRGSRVQRVTQRAASRQ